MQARILDRLQFSPLKHLKLPGTYAVVASFTTAIFDGIGDPNSWDFLQRRPITVVTVLKSRYRKAQDFWKYNMVSRLGFTLERAVRDQDVSLALRMLPEGYRRVWRREGWKKGYRVSITEWRWKVKEET